MTQQFGTSDLPPGFVKVRGRLVRDTGVMEFGFDLRRDAEVDARRDSARGERVTSDREFFTAFITGTDNVHIRSRHRMLRSRIRDVRPPWWWLPKYKRQFHGQTPWWVPGFRRRSFCNMMRLYGLENLIELAARGLDEGWFTVAQYDRRLAKTRLRRDVADKLATARERHVPNADRPEGVAVSRTSSNVLQALQSDPCVWGPKYADLLEKAAASGLIRKLYNDYLIDDGTRDELIRQGFITDLLESPPQIVTVAPIDQMTKG